MTTAETAAQQLPHPKPTPPEQPAAPEPGATPRTVDWNNPRVAAILDAAAKCFARKGFSATTLAEIGKELGLRKSIVHYYFASKAALIHEVQSYTYHKYLERVRDAIQHASDGNRAATTLEALWSATGEGNVGLNVEVWSASRNDEELRRRSAALQEEKRKLVADSVAAMLGPDHPAVEATCTLILGVLSGLSVSEHVEGAKAEQAYKLFLTLLRLGAQDAEALKHLG